MATYGNRPACRAISQKDAHAGRLSKGRACRAIWQIAPYAALEDGLGGAYTARCASAAALAIAAVWLSLSTAILATPPRASTSACAIIM